ncbi:serine/threonine-protein kinase [Aquabacterium sp. OR-4]|uniref:serine/threonine-protein kinase n=1 Tax=Aquabacterium sp. OR-4 TaxID=2978127 RepID=UPI0028CA63D3|nr:serine/threonine-protein kinase [Aquabacterium sp. OR-4]MDT7834143.1 serine/threonine-protein kinase [Aquabacterium sp. OR-4]
MSSHDPADPPSALPRGTRLGEYEIRRVLGVGGFGIVYLAFDHALEREVAIKEYMPGSLAGRSPATLEVAVLSQANSESFALGLRSFVNEARLLARFDHPSLVKVHRYWEAHHTAYMAMPFYAGQNLQQVRRLLQHPPDEAWLRSIVEPLLGALERLHREGVFHRDVSPDNVLLEPDGRPVLLDFGAARRVIGDKSMALTAILKPAYAPIEQYGEAVTVKQGPWTDLYALGATLHFLLLGRAPPPATTRTVHDDLVPLSLQALPGCSERFLRCVDWMLQPRPADRPQQVAELAEALAGRREPPLPATHYARTQTMRHGVPDTGAPAAAATTAPDATTELLPAAGAPPGWAPTAVLGDAASPAHLDIGLDGPLAPAPGTGPAGGGASGPASAAAADRPASALAQRALPGGRSDDIAGAKPGPTPRLASQAAPGLAGANAQPAPEPAHQPAHQPAQQPAHQPAPHLAHPPAPPADRPAANAPTGPAPLSHGPPGHPLPAGAAPTQATAAAPTGPAPPIIERLWPTPQPAPQAAPATVRAPARWPLPVALSAALAVGAGVWWSLGDGAAPVPPPAAAAASSAAAAASQAAVPLPSPMPAAPQAPSPQAPSPQASSPLVPSPRLAAPEAAMTASVGAASRPTPDPAGRPLPQTRPSSPAMPAAPAATGQAAAGATASSAPARAYRWPMLPPPATAPAPAPAPTAAPAAAPLAAPGAQPAPASPPAAAGASAAAARPAAGTAAPSPAPARAAAALPPAPVPAPATTTVPGNSPPATPPAAAPARAAAAAADLDPEADGMLLKARVLSPAERCEGRVLIALWACIERQCNRAPELRNHPECAKARREAEQRGEPR